VTCIAHKIHALTDVDYRPILMALGGNVTD
jgi:hypothetical protein